MCVDSGCACVCAYLCVLKWQGLKEQSEVRLKFTHTHTRKSPVMHESRVLKNNNETIQ